MSTDTHQTTSLEHVYAAALLDLAEADGKLDSIRQETDELVSLIRSQPDLLRLLSSRVLSAADRGGSLEKIFRGRIDDLLYRFLQVVNSKDRLDQIVPILEAFGRMVDERHGIIDVDAFVAAPLDSATAERISADLGKTLGGNVRLRQTVDPALIGGLKLRIGDRLIDASVATQLRKLKQQIVETGRENARGSLNQYLTQ